MKNVKFVAIALVMSMMLMGAGYAYFNDTIEVQGQVDTGILDMTITANPPQNAPTTGNGVVTTWATGDDTLTFRISETYPGKVSSVELHALNVGNIPARLESAIVSGVSGQQVVLDQLQARLDGFQLPNGGGFPGYCDAQGWTSVANLGYLLQDMSAPYNPIYQPNSNNYWGTLSFRIDPKTTVADNSAMDKEATFKLQLNFKQESDH